MADGASDVLARSKVKMTKKDHPLVHPILSFLQSHVLMIEPKDYAFSVMDSVVRSIGRVLRDLGD